MPEINQLTCSIELGRTNRKLKEYGTTYGNKQVQCYVAVPSEDVNFSIHLTSKGYTAPGLAMFVFIDGQYQCNRNRPGLMQPDDSDSPKDYEVDFRVRQKEERQPDEKFIGRDWSFEVLNTTQSTSKANKNFVRNVGTIEVIVLRLKASSISLGPRSAIDVGEGAPAPSETKANNANSKPSNKKEKKAAKIQEPKAEPKKVATPPASSVGGFGGMFGIFDGSSDFVASNPLTNNQHSLFGIDGGGPDASVQTNAESSSGLHLWTTVIHWSDDDDNDASERGSDISLVQDADSYVEDSHGQQEEHNDRDVSGRSKVGHGHPTGLDGMSDCENTGPNHNNWDQGAGQGNDWPGQGRGGSNGWGNQDQGRSRAGGDGSQKQGSINNGWGNQSQKQGSNNNNGWGAQSNNNNGWGAQSNNAGKVGNDWENKPKSAGKGSVNGWNNNDNTKAWDGNQNANGWEKQSKAPSHREKKEPGKRPGLEPIKENVQYGGGNWGDNAKPKERRSHHDKHSHHGSMRKPHRSSAASDAGSAAFEQPKTKEYWTDWKTGAQGYGAVSGSGHTVAASITGESTKQTFRDPYVFPAYDLPVMSKEDAQKRNVQAQVKTSKGAWYWHVTGTPDYMDSMESPYAVFTFKYRSKAALEKKCGKAIEESGEVYAQKLKYMTDAEKDDELMRFKLLSSQPDKVEVLTALPRKEMSVKEVVENWNDGNTQAVGWEAPKAGSKAPSNAPSKNGTKIGSSKSFTYTYKTGTSDKPATPAVVW